MFIYFFENNIYSGREWNNSDEHDESKDNNIKTKDINDLSNTSRLNASISIELMEIN